MRAKRESAYALLQQSRQALQERLDSLRAKLWRLELPPADARQVQQGLMQGYALLKNPRLLGGFADVAEIERERARVEQSLRSLDQVSALIDRARAAAPPG